MPKFFNFSKIMKKRNYGNRFNIKTKDQDRNVSYPLHVTQYRSGFLSNIRKLPLLYKNKTHRFLDPNHHEKFNYQGINYLIHNPFDLFSRDSKVHQTIANHSIIVYLNPVKTIIDKALEKYPISKRGCYLKDEKPLKFFKIYTKNNCRSECLSNRTLSVCGCVQFFMVRDASTRVCGVNDMKCYKKVDEETTKGDWCECYLMCGEIEYKTLSVESEFSR
jgi:hypothetical protein